MRTNGSPPATTNMAPIGGLFGSQPRPDDNAGASDNPCANTPSKDPQFRQPTNRFHPSPRGYSYPPSQPPFPGAPQFHHHAPFNMTPSSQPNSGATQGYPRYGLSWQAYDYLQRGYGGARMFRPQQFTGLAPASPGVPRVPPAPPGNNPVIRPTSSTSTAAGQLPGVPGRPPSHHPMKRVQPASEPRRTDVAGIADLPSLPEISYDKYNPGNESDDSSEWGGATGNAPISSKQTEFSLKQFAKRMGQPNISTFTKWKKVWEAGFLGKKHRSILWGQNCLKQLRDGTLRWETAFADFLNTFETWLCLENFDSAEWIQRQWGEMFLKECASKVQQARKKGRQGDNELATDLAKHSGKNGRGYLPVLPNTTSMVVIRQVPNDNNDQTSSNQLQAWYTDVRHWEELSDFIKQNCSPKEPYCLTAMYKCHLTQEE